MTGMRARITSRGTTGGDGSTNVLRPDDRLSGHGDGAPRTQAHAWATRRDICQRVFEQAEG
jgi:hypothetical protein